MRRGLVVLAVLASAAPNEEGGSRDARILLEGADTVQTRGDCASALRLFQKAAGSNNRNIAARARLYTGLCLERSGSQRAAQTYRSLLREYPDQQVIASYASARLKALGPEATMAGKLKRGLVQIRESGSVRVQSRPFLSTFLERRSELWVSTMTGVALIDTGARRFVRDFDLGARVTALTASRDGSRVFAGCQTGSIHVIDTANRSIASFSGLRKSVADIGYAGEGKPLLIAAKEGGLKSLDVTSGRIVTLKPGWFGGLAVPSSGSEFFASFAMPDPVRHAGHDDVGRFDWATGTLTGRLTAIPLVASNLQLMPDDSQLWANGADACSAKIYDGRGCPSTGSGIVHIIEPRSMRLIRSLTMEIGLMTPYPDGSLMAGQWQAGICLLDVNDFRLVHTIPIPSSGRITFSRDGRTAFVPIWAENRVAILEISEVGSVRWRNPRG